MLAVGTSRETAPPSRARARVLSGLWAAVAIVLALAGSEVAHAQANTGTVRVAPSGADVVGCGSVVAPCATLQFAVDEFTVGSTGTILVAAGTYISAATREIVRVTGRVITISGGYTTAFTVASPSTNVVSLDGQDARRCVTVDPHPTETTSLNLSGVTLTRGNAPQELVTNVLSSFGGGLDAFQTTIGLTDIRFVNNMARGLDAGFDVPGDGAGGGLSLRVATATLSGVEFTGNTAKGGDGNGTAFRGGLGVGGGLFAIQSSVTMQDVTADMNIASAGDAPNGFGAVAGQRADGLGGFLALIQSTADIDELSACDNVAEGGQADTLGGLGLGGGLMIEDSSAPVSVNRATLCRNNALGADATSFNGGLGGGGGIFCTDCELELTASAIVSNRAEGGTGVTQGGDGGGGGIYMDSVAARTTQLDATNVVIGKNSVVAGAGSTPGFAFGGGLFQQCPQAQACPSPGFDNNFAILMHATVAENSVSGATFNQGAAFYISPGAVLQSDFGIISGHTTPMTMDDRGEAVLVLGTATFEDTLWNNNPLKSFAPNPSDFTDISPLTGSPDYVDAAADPPDYHILATSAAIGQAVGSTTPIDLDGETRPAPSTIPDLGADEFYVPEPQPQILIGAALLTLSVLRGVRKRQPSPVEVL